MCDKETIVLTKTSKVIALGIVLMVLGLYALAIIMGDLNQDEGWYLYAGRMVFEGYVPFRDFASTQGPLMAYVYALAYPLVRLAGVAGGRLFTALCGLLTLLLSANLAARLATRRIGPEAAVPAALLVGGLLGLNLYHVYFTSLVKTYGLAGLLVALGFVGLERSLNHADRLPGGRAWRLACGWAMMSAGCFALAAGTRLSAGILLPALWLPVAVLALRNHTMRRRWLPVLIGMPIGGTLVLAALFLPFILMAPQAVRFGLLDYHAGRDPGSVFLWLVYKAGFVLRLVSSYFPLVVAATVGWIGMRWMVPMPKRERGLYDHLPLLMLIGVAAVSLVHVAAPFPYDDYQVFVMPFLTLPAIMPLVAFLQHCPEVRLRRLMPLVLLMLVSLHSASSPMLKTWVTSGQDRIWWPLRSETALQSLRHASTIIREMADKDDWLLTQDTYLAVETDMRVPRGLEMGPFSFFPELDDTTAMRFHVLNEARLQTLIKTSPAPVAAISGYAMAIASPAITPVEPDLQARLLETLESYYETAYHVDHFGQGGTTLKIMIRRAKP